MLFLELSLGWLRATVAIWQHLSGLKSHSSHWLCHMALGNLENLLVFTLPVK